MNGVLDHNSELLGYTKSETTRGNVMKFDMNHAPGAGSIARTVDLQSTVLPQCYLLRLQLEYQTDVFMVRNKVWYSWQYVRTHLIIVPLSLVLP